MFHAELRRIKAEKPRKPTNQFRIFNLNSYLETNFAGCVSLFVASPLQSHAKNDWQTIATVCIFLACKLEETPRFLNDFVVVAYEMMNKWDRLLLSTITFDLDIQLPYKPLVVALKKLNIFRDHLARVAWNFYRPHYIVDGSMFVAAKLQKVKLPTEKGRVWWLGKYAYLCHHKCIYIEFV
ncbi:hypothetical protein UlMin_019527 [Ulmus minor]